MQKKTVTPEAKFRELVKEQLDQKELDTKKSWKNPSGPLMNKLKGCYYVTAVFSFLVFLLNEMIFLLMFGNNDFVTEEQTVFFAKNHWLVHVLFAISVVAFVIMLCKKTKTACYIQLVAGSLAVLQTLQVFSGLYTNQATLGALYLASLLSTVFVLGMLALFVAYHYRLKKKTETEIQALYQQNADVFDLLGADRWEELLEKYVATTEKGKQPEKNEE